MYVPRPLFCLDLKDEGVNEDQGECIYMIEFMGWDGGRRHLNFYSTATQNQHVGI